MWTATVGGEMDVEKKYIPVRAAADFLGVPASTINRWLNDGMIAHLKVPFGTKKHTFLVDAADLKRFEKAHRREPRKPGRPRLEAGKEAQSGV